MKKSILLIYLLLTSLLIVAQKASYSEIPSITYKFRQNRSQKKKIDSYTSDKNSTSDLYKKQNEDSNTQSTIISYQPDSDYLISPKPIKNLSFTGELGYSRGNSYPAIEYLKLNTIALCNIIPYISIGIGSGFRYALNVKDALIPFYADIRTRLPQKGFPLYLAIDIGYSLDVTSDYRTEGLYFLFNPSVGYRMDLTKNSVLNFSIGYDEQRLKLGYTNYNVKPGTTITTWGLSINTGITFR